MIRFTVLGEPKGKARPRFSRYGVYTAADTANYERLVASECYAAMSAEDHIHAQDPEKRYKLTVTAFFGIPKSFTKAKTIMAKNGQILPNKKPDGDNILKIICDALNDVAWVDDKQVVDMRVIKKYSADGGRVDVEIEAI